MRREGVCEVSSGWRPVQRPSDEHVTFEVQGHHRRVVLQPVDDLTLISPIILQGEFCDDQRRIQGGGALQVDASMETAVTPFVEIHGDEHVHLEPEEEVIRSSAPCRELRSSGQRDGSIF